MVLEVFSPILDGFWVEVYNVIHFLLFVTFWCAKKLLIPALQYFIENTIKGTQLIVKVTVNTLFSDTFISLDIYICIFWVFLQFELI